MKRYHFTYLFAASLFWVASMQTAKAQKIVLHMTGNQKAEYDVSQLDSITFEDATGVYSLMGNDAECSLFYEALIATGLGEVLDQNNKDESWDYSPYLSYEEIYYLPSFSQYCHLPKTRENGVTVMACTNEALNSKYGIHDLQGFYDFALSVYGGHPIDVNTETDKLRTDDCPLRKLLSYCIINRKSTIDRLTTFCSFIRPSVPTEWYSTLLPQSLLKVTNVGLQMFLNLSGNHLDEICVFESHTPHVSENGSYYLTDGLPLYNSECKQAFASERMRMDFYTLIPELENTMMRFTNSYVIPHNYLHSISASENTYLIYEDTQDTSPLYEGDCLWLCGRYDATIKLPAPPKSGTYEVRIGYTAMPDNGICQIYFGSDPQTLVPVGIPMDFRQNADELPWLPQEDASYTDEQKSESRKNMRNYGFMHGPDGIAYISNPETRQGTCFCDNPNTLRRIILRQELDEHTQYYLRFKSVIDGDRPICLDYLELVHKDVFDNPEIPEDIY